MRIENSVTRVTVRHHKACRVMPNSYPEWRNFQFAPNNHYRFFFLHTLPSTIAFRLECVLFCHIYAEITTFSIKRCSVRFLSKTLASKCLAENRRQDVENDVETSKLSSWRNARESSETTFSSPGRVHGNDGRVCKNKRTIGSAIIKYRSPLLSPRSSPSNSDVP